MTTAIEPWQRPAFRATGRDASVMLIAFADTNVLGGGAELRVRDAVPPTAPLAALDLRIHQYADSAAWIDTWRTGALRNLAAQQPLDLDRLDAATWCYSISIAAADPADLTHLQLAWAVAAGIAAAGAFAALDVFAANWLTGASVAALSPHRPFTVQQEVSLIAETEPAPGFGHPVHTRGMLKFGRPDLVAGVPADRIEETGRILNHLARMLAEGHVLTPGQVLRFDGRRALTVAPYAPDATTPELHLNNDGLLLVDA
ncbi:hypothetical protein ACFO1B_16320 [Dactylosporangium siamense]|uniref:DUF4261 domain-containing protein n=1 Tax=Dactylosporangium siamense TaxID=685454 RepID=A0A919PKV9_9ACTN|nr:hypothetical protein [Dactylosporangium siamense]GIG45407.1 hypothetical protein Dsi01nite_034480 [Dactylosporangium siamense]